MSSVAAAPAFEGSSLLVSIRSNGRTLEEGSGCPNRVGSGWLNVATGEVRPARCGALKCLWCGPINALITAGAIDLARPERLVTLTLVGDQWQTIRFRMKRLTYRVREEVGPVCWSWHVEPNPKGTGHHVHALQHGSFIPVRRLSALAQREGMGRVVDIRRVRAGDRAGWYGLKMAAAAYTLKLARQEESYRQYLAANGGRLVHTSRGFWRDTDGSRIKGVRGARERALREAFGPPVGRWIPVSRGRRALVSVAVEAG